MNQKLAIGIILSCTSLSLVQAMSNDMMMKKDDNGTMMASTTPSMHEGMPMYESVSLMSKKEEVRALQMMLVDKGYLIMPKGVSYGYYGQLTKKAHKKYKASAMMMKSGGDTSMMKATDTMMMKP